MPMTPSLRVRAVNTATDSENQIHDDSVAAEYGFRGGLVPGVTIYGYLAPSVIGHFGPKWLNCGALDVRFFEPFYEGEEVAVSITGLPEGRIKIEAGSRASGTAWLDNVIDDAAQPAAHSAHPAIILGLANELLMYNYCLGPWIHASSEARNAKPARDGERLEVRGAIADAFERKGHEFVILDVAILSAGDLVSRIRHTAIWKPA